ncbi:hypothetical protein PsAD2_04190 [Pseudovibrio axinellae]|uniref:DUF2147 domain-containing protein n=1 Tax=Pseudovibrio axinellae TaxID=989403 RepID=A0A165TVG1_9HYPH|nr:DUF2147 domain-containing protein [Pseudovibrio axinellae]KZL06677.1 hypothetical protein PsAD2_04190 [Pseudovibrio axinellae]SER60529.1 Uncharacterized conserved protein, DUF2147 family [Pseudovibrio axinellae]
MKAIILKASLAATLSIGLTTSALAADAAGTWLRANGSAKIKIAKCGGGLCGNIVWLKKPSKDIHNKDPKLRGRSLIGTQTILGMKPNGDSNWKGKIYNAEDGKTYSGNLKLVSANKLKVEGCVMVFCRGETWTRTK